MAEPRRIVVGISGGSGAALAIRCLELLKEQAPAVEVHLIVTEGGQRVLGLEMDREVGSLAPLVAHVHACDDFTAPIASGSYRTEAMIVVPCSMKTLAGIANGYAENLLLRAADVCLKERRRLVLVAREAPLSLIHIDNMRKVTAAGAIVMPPVLTLYTRPQRLAEVIDQVVGKILDLVGIEAKAFKRWQ